MDRPMSRHDSSPQWSSSREEALLQRVRAHVAGEPGALGPEDPAQLVALTAHLWTRGHSPQVKNLQRSSQLTRCLRLLAAVAIYPPGADSPRLAERVALLTEIVTQSPQRPVAEHAALTLLELWRQGLLKPEASAALCAALKRPREVTLPGMSLLIELDPAIGEEILGKHIGRMHLNDRRARLGELVALLDASPDSAGLESIVRASFEALFRGLTPDQRQAMVDRLFRELQDRRSLERHDKWRLLVEPLFVQNMGNRSVQVRVLELVAQARDARQVWPFVAHLMRAEDERLWPDVVYDFLMTRADRRAIPLIYPKLQAPLSRLAPLATRATRAKLQACLDAIVEREQLEGVGGALSVASGEGGELTLAQGVGGELTLSAAASSWEGAGEVLGPLTPRPRSGLGAWSRPQALALGVVLSALLIGALMAAAWLLG